MWLQQVLAPTSDPYTWKYIGKPKVVRQIAAIDKIVQTKENVRSLRRYLDGWFWWEIAEKRKKELLETVEGMEARLRI